MNTPEIILLLTGTVKPGNMSFTKLADPGIRLDQYIDTIEYYAEHFPYPVVFVENSGVDISGYLSIKDPSKLEILSFRGNDYPPEKGKSYGEMEILKHAMEHSVLIKRSTHIVKITGRYKIRNLDSFLNYFHSFNGGIDIHADLSRNLTFSDSRFFIAAKSFFRDLFIYQEQVDDSKGVYMEHIVCKATLSFVAKGMTYKPFKYFPRYSGYYATTGKKYNTSIWYAFPRKIKYYLKYISITR